MVGKKKAISVSQRKYFEKRITDACDEQISNIKYINASKIVEISKREHELYLKKMKVDTKLKKYLKVCKELKTLEDDLLPVVTTLKETLPQKLQSWDSARKYTSIYATNTNINDLPKAFQQLHQETMKDKNMGTKMNKQIAHIKAKQQEALDFLYGLNDLDELREGLNNILGKADIKLLGDSNA
jgi:hypothetical protein